MIRAAARTAGLVQRLRARAADTAARRVASLRRRSARADWHSPAALWPDLFGDLRDGK